jgi:hypothetical protein
MSLNLMARRLQNIQVSICMTFLHFQFSLSRQKAGKTKIALLTSTENTEAAKKSKIVKEKKTKGIRQEKAEKT